MNMFTLKSDDESLACPVCGGPMVPPFPCQRGCSRDAGDTRRKAITRWMTNGLLEEIPDELVLTPLPDVKWKLLEPPEVTHDQ